MTVLNGCEFPEDRAYFIERTQMTWVQRAGGVVTVGLTDPAQTRAGRILYVRVKPAGTARERGKAIATVESGKWAGAVLAPVSGTVLEANPELEVDPGLLNTDPYGRGWLVRMTMSAPAEFERLLSGEAALARFKEILERDNIHCMRCQDVTEGQR
jgi:glycine cleavage system H protein